MIHQTHLTLNSGYKVPQLGIGTWLSQPHEIGHSLKTALDAGYRHIDCAPAYLNEKEVGQVLAKYLTSGKIKREDLFITSKVWSTRHSYAECLNGVDITLKDLGLTYLDMLLIHWPMGLQEKGGDFPFPKDQDGKLIYSDVDYLETWRAMEEAVKAGKVKSIGLSNFNIQQMERVMKNCTIKPANLQIEVHPYFSQRELLDWCTQHEILVTAYSPLANPVISLKKPDAPDLLNDPVLTEIAHKREKTVAQVVLKWGVQRNTIVIPKGTKKTHILENFSIWDFQLTSDQMASIDELNKNWRILDCFTPGHKHNPF